MMSCVVTFCDRHSQGLVDGILVRAAARPEVRLDLRPESLDRRVVLAVGRQRPEPGTRPPDGRRRGRGLMGGQRCPIRPRRRRAAPAPAPARHTTRTPRCRSTPGTPGGHVPRPDPQRGDHGQRFPRAGGRADGPLAARGPAVGLGHCRGHPRLVHVNQPVSARTRFTFLRNDRRCLLDVGPVGLVGVLGLRRSHPCLRRCARSVVRLQLKPPRWRSGWSSGVVVVLPDADLVQAPQLVGGAQHAGRAAPVRLRGQRLSF